MVRGITIHPLDCFRYIVTLVAEPTVPLGTYVLKFENRNLSLKRKYRNRSNPLLDVNRNSVFITTNIGEATGILCNRQPLFLEWESLASPTSRISE